jgi:glycosyltransferase involved in cell wall biosynthesis
MKACLIDSKPAPFRVDWYNLLRKNGIDIVMTAKATRHGFDTSKLDYTFLKNTKFPLFSNGICLGLFNHLRTQNYDIVIACDLGASHTYIAYLYAKLFRKKFILWDEQWGKWSQSPKAKLVYPLIKHILRHSDAWVATGTLAKQWLISEGAIPEKTFIAINAGEDLSKMVNQQRVEEIRKKYELEGYTTFLRVSRLVVYKDFETTFEAFNQLPKNCKLLVVGGEENRKSYATPEGYGKELIQKYQSDRIIFVGEIPHEDVANFYSATDIFVHTPKPIDTQLNNIESWGFCVNEAMSISKPLILSDDVGASGDAIDESNGYIVKSNEVTSLAMAMKSILKQDLNKMGKSSRNKIDTIFTVENNARGILEAIDYVQNH